MDNYIEMLGSHQSARLSANSPAQLIVVVDAEEEFNWNSLPDRSSTRVSAMDRIFLVQEIFDQYNIKPCYVIDYPVVNQDAGNRALLDIYKKGRCEIGAHLHPWVNPPFEEELSSKNTYPGNLPMALERAKLQVLTERITAVFGDRPIIYKAGRYGVGPNTGGILSELGYKIDLSLCPPIDNTSSHGPDFSDCHSEPFWFGENESLLEIPVSGAFVGWSGKFAKPLYKFADKHANRSMPGILSRLSVVDRLILSPEGFSSKEHIKLTEFLYRKGVRTFTWSMHSPSLVPGYTPYVNNKKQLNEFLDSFRYFFDYFFGKLGGEATSPTRLWHQLRKEDTPFN